MRDYSFVDSNVWIYAFFPEDESSYKRLLAFLRKTFKEHLVVVSFQVINEVCFNLKKKGFPEEKIKKIIRSFERRRIIVDFSLDILKKASDIRKRHSFSFWDSLIVASALAAGCSVLYSEDMQDGQIIEGKLRIRNPFSLKKRT